MLGSGQAIEPLKELARRWREYTEPQTGTRTSGQRCADELESLLPALSAAIAEQVRLERAAALQEAATICNEATITFDSGMKLLPTRDEIVQRILARISDSSRSALDAHDAEVRDRALEEAAGAIESHMIYTGPGAIDPEPIQIALALRIRGMKHGE